ENPFTGSIRGYEVPITLLLIGLLGGVFLKGFGEAISIAVGLVGTYLILNLIVIVRALVEIGRKPETISDWQESLTVDYSNPLLMLGAALLLFPKLALGLSGFETGVVVMPLVKGNPGDNPKKPVGRIRNTHRLLTAAAVIMSVFLLASSVVTTLLIPHATFEEGGEANGRALAYLAHELMGDGLGTVYDASTILILWFAGASAMAGLLNIVPRYLPRYGMAPDWACAMRPLVLIFTAICFLVTILFRASVDAQAGAYATGVLAVITSATVAVTLDVARRKQTRATVGFGAVATIFVYTTMVTIFSNPRGLQIACLFVVGIVITSLVSRAARSTELRAEAVVLDEVAEQLVRQAARKRVVRLIANHPDERTSREYLRKEREEREASNIPRGDPVLFLEVTVGDASEFSTKLLVRGEIVDGFDVLERSS
ncbi:MAG: amino acid transporter, partial [Chloroflexi bacterium]|nr:amino acid transporter [Chloroflexota bacterium]